MYVCNYAYTHANFGNMYIKCATKPTADRSELYSGWFFRCSRFFWNQTKFSIRLPMRWIRTVREMPSYVAIALGYLQLGTFYECLPDILCKSAHKMLIIYRATFIMSPTCSVTYNFYNECGCSWKWCPVKIFSALVVFYCRLRIKMAMYSPGPLIALFPVHNSVLRLQRHFSNLHVSKPIDVCIRISPAHGA